MSVACTPALTQDTAFHLWMLRKPIPTKVKTGLAGIRGNSVRPRKRAEYGLAGVLRRGRLLLEERRLWRCGEWEREWDWVGLRRDWRVSRVRVSRTGCVLRREVCLDKIFPLLFYLCEGRWAGLGYAHP